VLVRANNHNQHLRSDLIKPLMTCHSRAGQMFIDAQYQPHSSSVRVKTLAAISPTTPTQLALPLHNTGENCSQATDSGCWAVAMCFHAIRGEVSFVFIYLLVFHSHCLACAATSQHLRHLCRTIAPSLSPFVMWKQPFSCGDSLSSHPDAWHSWQIGCGSEGDGLWKQCPCPHYTHSPHIQSQTHKYKNITCVEAILHTTCALSPALGQRTKVVLQTGWWPGCISHKERQTGNGYLDFLQVQPWLQHTFQISPELFNKLWHSFQACPILLFIWHFSIFFKMNQKFFSFLLYFYLNILELFYLIF